MLKAGIIGLPNVGKSTLFNALTKNNALAANYPFATIEPNQGVVFVKDERLAALSKIYVPKRVVPTAYEFIDIAGLVRGASKGEGLGNKFLSHIREVDAICQVVRVFNDHNITHVDGIVDPIRDIETIKFELFLADLEQIAKRQERLEKKLKIKDKEAIIEMAVLDKIKTALDANISPRDLLDEDEKKLVKAFNLLSLKPMLLIANISEDDLLDDSDNEDLQNLYEYAKKENLEVVKINAQVEMELNSLSDEDRIEYLKSFNLNTSGLDELILKSYELLGLKTYFTAGENEVRAWTFTNGMKAPECAGIIHTDFMRGFIRAETLAYSDLILYGSPLKAKEAGKVRLEGKEYLVNDGDIMLFRFNI